ncbi:MAG: hypothetical protein J6X66_02685 [Lachnospiraceae bacterium]|nr:hypothetical protein [Lachnospiraceae bacterium]
MQRMIYRNQVEDYTKELEEPVIAHINEGQIETFEAFDNFDIIAFDWYDIRDVESEPSQILIYIDKDDVFIICENENSYNAARKCFTETDCNERTLFTFFKKLFVADNKYLEKLEDNISDLDDKVIHGISAEVREQIVDMRYHVLHLKKYYEQFETIFDELIDNDNNVLGDEFVKYFEILNNRIERISREVMNLKEYIVQVRESYQAQIDIEQNRLMKVFTLVTSIFMPLSLIAGWYGMNLKMPEFEFDYSYPIVIGVCVLIVLTCFIVFKKKGWLKKE